VGETSQPVNPPPKSDLDSNRESAHDNTKYSIEAISFAASWLPADTSSISATDLPDHLTPSEASISPSCCRVPRDRFFPASIFRVQLQANGGAKHRTI
jgi:hypothetical protein